MACGMARFPYLKFFALADQFTMKSLFCGILAASLLVSGAFAQFHSRSMTGHAAYNQDSLNSAQAHFNSNRPTGAQPTTTVAPTPAAQAAVASHGNTQFGFNGGSTIFMSEAQKAAYSQYDLQMSEQKDLNIDVWGRSIYHSDGSYTESQEHNEGDAFLQQTTYSKNGVEIQRRSITLDQRGMPDEVMIYAGGENGKLKYRGKHLYDQFGRFSEEHLFSADGTLIRRKVQEYSPEGKRLPLRSWDYIDYVPSDLQLVVTRESEDPALQQVTTPAQPQQPQRGGIFIRNKSQQQNADAGKMMVGHAGGAEQEATAKTSMGSKLGRLFGNRK